MNLRLLPDIPLSELEPGLRRVEERLEQITTEDLRRIGKHAKSVDPEMISRLRADGYPVGAKAIGIYIYENDPDLFSDLLLDL